MATMPSPLHMQWISRWHIALAARCDRAVARVGGLECVLSEHFFICGLPCSVSQAVPLVWWTVRP